MVESRSHSVVLTILGFTTSSRLSSNSQNEPLAPVSQVLELQEGATTSGSPIDLLEMASVHLNELPFTSQLLLG